MGKIFTLPSGQSTEDPAVFRTEWNKLIKPLERIFTKYYVGGFGPDFLMLPRDQSCSQSFKLPMIAAKDLIANVKP